MADSEKPIVKYDRRFSSYFSSIFALSKVESDLLNAVLSILRERKTVRTVILADEIIDRTKYLERNSRIFTKEKLIEHINNMTNHVGGIFYCLHDDNSKFSERKLLLFDSFGLDPKTGDFEITLGQSFSQYFFNIEKNRPFTRYYLDNYCNLKSKYTKALYRLFLDHFGGFTIKLSELFALLEIENAATKRSFISRMPVFLHEIEQTGDFDGKIEYTIAKKKRANYSITFVYKEMINRISESEEIDQSEQEKQQQCASPASSESLNPTLICPYCGDQIVELKNKKDNTKFWTHAHWDEHQNCLLKNQNSREQMISEIDEAQKRIKTMNEKKQEAQIRMLALEELFSEHPDGMPFQGDIMNRTSEDIERAEKGFSENDIRRKIVEIKARELSS